MAARMLQKAQADDRLRGESALGKKQAQRREYGIGWGVQHIPRTPASLSALATAGAAAPAMYGVMFDQEAGSMRTVEVGDPAGRVILEYLSVSLQVRRGEGREPRFSLDPVERNGQVEGSRQVKRFEPEWLKGTSVGDVMFQADYYLKELSMGEYDQPVLGMKSCFDIHEGEWGGEAWNAREWFVVKQAEVLMSEDGILVPSVEMGVEAREQRLVAGGGVEDAPITRHDHPLVRYAEQFTRNFDLIAERRSAVFHLRELAKAALLAKFMLSARPELESTWFEFVDWPGTVDAAAACRMEIPQLWSDRCSLTISVQDSAMLTPNEDAKVSLQSVYGGVQFGLDRFDLPLARHITAQAMTLPNLRMAAPSTAIGAEVIARSVSGVSRHLKPLSLEQITSRVPGAVAAALPGAEVLQPPAYPSMAPAGGIMAAAIAMAGQTGQLVPAQPAAPTVARVGALAYPRRSRAPPIAPAGFRVVAPTISVLGRPRGVDLSLDSFSLSASPSATDSRVAAGSRDSAVCPAGGLALLEALDVGKADSRLELLRAVFVPAMTDRRQEGELFVGPSEQPAYEGRLRRLVEQEQRVRRARESHFLCKGFDPEAAGPLFPSSWTSRVSLVQWRPPAHLDEDCDDAEEDRAAAMSRPPAFDRTAEDGLRLRIYRHGRTEVRTMQLGGGPERVGAVFARRSAVPSSIWGAEKVASVIVAVAAEEEEQQQEQEQDAPRQEGATETEGGSAPAHRHLLMLKTQGGAAILTWLLPCGRVSWKESDQVEEHWRGAKVVNFVDCSRATLTVQDFRLYASSHVPAPASADERRRYARSACNWARREAGYVPASFLRWRSDGRGGDSAVARPAGG